jgi:hypothetical protein
VRRRCVTPRTDLETIVPEGGSLKGCACPIPGKPRSGSRNITFGSDRIEEFNRLWQQELVAVEAETAGKA